MNNNMFKRVICMVIALMLIMPALPGNMVGAVSDNGNGKGNSEGDDLSRIVANTTTSSAITLNINVDLYSWNGNKQTKIDNFDKSFLIENYDPSKGVTVTYDDLLVYGILSKYNINLTNSSPAIYLKNSTLKSINIDKGLSDGSVVNVDYEIHLKDGGGVLWLVTFEDWDGIVLKEEWVKNGEDATPPSKPSRDGYTFDKWDGTYTKVTKNETVTAKYNQNKYTVTFKAGPNGSLTGTEIFENVLHGTAWGTAITTVPTPVADTGYKFIGWTPSTFATTVTKDLEYTASFALDDGQSHTVTFIAGANGSLTGTTIYNVPVGTSWETAVTTVPTTLANPGYKFDGWTPTPFAANVIEDLAYTANFIIDEEQWNNVTFIAGANGSLSGTTLYANILDGTEWVTAVTTVPTPVADKGYKFDGWTPTPFAATVTEDLVYTANFVLDNVLSHTVTFVAGANGTLDGTTLYANILDGTAWETAVTVPTPVADKGYKFDGWTPIPFAATVTEDLVYTANFVLDNVLSHNVTFVAGANGTLDGTTLYANILDGTEWGTAVTIVPTPVANKGYKFDGWTPTPFEATVTEELVYTANFVEKEDGGNNGGGNDDKDRDDDDENEPTITIDDSQTPAGGPIVEPEVPEETEEPEVIEELEKIEELEVPQATLPDTGSVLNTTLLAAIGLLLIIAGMFINKFKLIRG